MREKIARALQAEAQKFSSPVGAYVAGESFKRWNEANPNSDYYDDGPGYETDEELESWKILADAVLAAMREPTEAMLEAAREAGLPLVHLDSMSAREDLKNRTAWQAMIDAA